MSKNFDKNILENLQKLGLSEKESIVYLDLLDNSMPVGSSKIIRSTDFHGQFVYNSLYALEEKGLVKHSIVNGRKKFEAASLDRIMNLVEEQRITAERTVDLLKTISKKPLEQEFEVYQGENAYIQHQFDVLNTMSDGGEILIISTDWGELFTEKRLDFLPKYEERRIEKNVSVRFILNEGLRKQAMESKQKRPNVSFCFLPEHQSYGGICIFDDLIDFHLMGDPIMVFAFKNSKVTQGYRNFFEVLWTMGSK